MQSLIILIDKVLEIYSWIIIVSAIVSWLVAFGVINIRNQLVRITWPPSLNPHTKIAPCYLFYCPYYFFI